MRKRGECTWGGGQVGRKGERDWDWPHGIVAPSTRQVSEAFLDLSVRPAFNWSQMSEQLSQQWELRFEIWPQLGCSSHILAVWATQFGPTPQREMNNSYCTLSTLEPQNCEQNIVIMLIVNFCICYIAMNDWNTNEETEIQKNSITCPETVRTIVINYIFNCLCPCSFQRTLQNLFLSLANLSVTHSFSMCLTFGSWTVIGSITPWLNYRVII